MSAVTITIRYDEYVALVEASEQLNLVTKELKWYKKELLKSEAYNEKIRKENKNQKIEYTNLNEENKTLKNDNASKQIEIERLKGQLNKDSNNSSKPSSTDSPYKAKSKKAIVNNRIKTNNKKGGQFGHNPHFLGKDKIEELLKQDGVEHNIVEVNKRDDDTNYFSEYKVDTKTTVIVTEYRYYNTAKTPGNPITYGNAIKAFSCLLMTKGNVSTDNTVDIISALTNDKVDLSKGSLINWMNTLSDKLTGVSEWIEQQLLNSDIIHVDETPTKINGVTHYIHNVSNGSFTLQFVTKTKGADALEEIGVLKQYHGILIHDHYTLYYNFGVDHGECNQHVLRYLNGIIQLSNHKWAFDLAELLLKMKKRKEELQQLGFNEMPLEEIEEFTYQYRTILCVGYAEFEESIGKNVCEDDERRLLNRLKKYEHNHLLFIKNFDVPFTNNRAEADIRFVKRKTKMGAFRSLEGAKTYVKIYSCLSTYRKQGTNIFKAIKEAFEGNAIIL